MRASRILFALTPLCALLAAGSVHATNGYFSHGYGIKAKGMGGASVAMTNDTFAGANNPAAAAWAGNRMEVGMDFFSPKRSMDRLGLGNTNSDSNLFYVPEFGYNRVISDKIGVGVTVYGNGGMNTNYPGEVIPPGGCGPGSPASNLFCGTGRLGVDMMQLIVAPTLAYKVSENHSIGISPLLVYQTFSVQGLSAFGVPNMGYDKSSGFGVRLGYLGKLNEKVSIGASYSPRISMSKFSDYSGLFAEQGDFDIPENYSLGVSFQATPTVTVAIDYARISYSSIRSIANPSVGLGGPLGSATGPGFGWSDIDVWKLGAQWQATPNLAMRAGLNVGDNPISSADASFNTLAPGVTTTHYTLGGTYSLSKTTEISMSYMYAPSNSVTGPNAGGSTDTIKMSQQAIGIQYGWRW